MHLLLVRAASSMMWPAASATDSTAPPGASGSAAAGGGAPPPPPPPGNDTGLVAGPGQVVVAPKKGDLVRLLLSSSSFVLELERAPRLTPRTASRSQRMVPFNIAAKPGETVEFIWGAGVRPPSSSRRRRRSPPRADLELTSAPSLFTPAAAHGHAVVGGEHLQRVAGRGRVQERHAERVVHVPGQGQGRQARLLLLRRRHALQDGHVCASPPSLLTSSRSRRAG